ncbi:MAG: sigma factor-like helix-turn-helix DNA-binding protein [Planctomycetota bacterium]
MEEREQGVWGHALRRAHTMMRRYRDDFTRTAREDLAQDAAVALWRFSLRRTPTGPISKVLSTITWRTRVRAVQRANRRIDRVADGDCSTYASQEPAAEPLLRVNGWLVPRSWLLDRLEAALHRVDATNRQILLAFYEGCGCAEIGVRFGLTEDAVKVRLHRCRKLVRKRLESMTRAAGHFEA